MSWKNRHRKWKGKNKQRTIFCLCLITSNINPVVKKDESAIHRITYCRGFSHYNISGVLRTAATELKQRQKTITFLAFFFPLSLVVLISNLDKPIKWHMRQLAMCDLVWVSYFMFGAAWPFMCIFVLSWSYQKLFIFSYESLKYEKYKYSWSITCRWSVIYCYTIFTYT